MTTQPLTIRFRPRVILHVDADAFFASYEQAVCPELRGKPVITGKERGLVAAASYGAKARGSAAGHETHRGEKGLSRCGETSRRERPVSSWAKTRDRGWDGWCCA